MWQWSYSAFGDNAPTIAKNRFADLSVTPNPGTTGIAALEFNVRYEGQYSDKESGLFHNYFRSYDPRTGRYTQNDPIGLDGGWSRVNYAHSNALRYSDPDGLNPIAGAIGGAEFGSVFGPVGTVVGGLIGAGAGAWIGWSVTGPMWAKAPDNARDPNGPKAPGRPGTEEGFSDPKGGENWVRNPFPGRGGSSHGWEDDRGRVWCPTGQGGRAHGGPHWDVELPNGKHINVPPGQNINDLLR